MTSNFAHFVSKCTSFFAFVLTSTMLMAQANLQISEVMVNPSDPNDQWVEVHNHGNVSISIRNWGLFDENENLLATITRGGPPNLPIRLDPGTYFIIYNPTSPNATLYSNINNANNVGAPHTINWFSNIPTNIGLALGTSSNPTSIDWETLGGAYVFAQTGRSGELPVSRYSFDPDYEGANPFNWLPSVRNGGTPGSAYRTIKCWNMANGFSACNGVLPDTTVLSFEVVGGFTVSDCTIVANNLIVSDSNSFITILQPSSGVRKIEVNGNITNNGNITLHQDNLLLQNNTSVFSGSGTSRYIRTVNTTPARFQMFSSPVSNASLSQVFGLPSSINYCDIFTYDFSKQEYRHDWPLGFSATCFNFNTNISNSVVFGAGNNISNPDGLMNVGVGYFATGRDGGGTYNRGFSSSSFNNGSISVSLSGASSGDWALLGNPYPSGLSASAFLLNNPSINTALYFWEQSLDWDGSIISDYKVWTNLGSLGDTINGAIKDGANLITNLHVAPTQGFFVEMNGNGNTVNFDNSMRSELVSRYYKKDPSSDNIPKLWLRLNNEKNSDKILLGIADDAELERDNYDARKLFPMKAPVEESNFELDQNWNRVFFYSKESSSSINYAIQAIPTTEAANGYLMPLGFYTNRKGIHTIEIDSTYILKNTDIVLIDHENGNEFVLTKPYSFEISEEGEYNTRFSLRFDVSPLITGVDKPFTNDNIEIFQSFENIVVRSNEVGIKNISITDLAGRQHYHRNTNGRNEFSIEKGNFNNGLMLVTLSLEDGRRVSKKLFIR